MKRLFKASFWAALVVALSLGALTWLFWEQRTVWPAFSQAPPAAGTAAVSPLAPRVVVQVERDYGWRTGDRIPITIYVKQMPGTIVDTTSLAIEGDFEILQQPKALVAREQKDGSWLYKIEVDVQSMNVQRSWTLNANMSYHVTATGDDNSVSLPGLKLYTSMTYDGRKQIQEGSQAFAYGNEALIVGLILAASMIGLIFGYRQYRKGLAEEKMRGQPKPPAVPLTPLLKVAHNFKIVWSRIQRGDYSVENYKELERNIRWLFHIEARTLKQIDLELEMTHNPFHQEVMIILTECDKVLYQEMYLSDAEHKAVYDAFQRIFAGQPMPPKPKPPVVIWHDAPKQGGLQAGAEKTPAGQVVDLNAVVTVPPGGKHGDALKGASTPASGTEQKDPKETEAVAPGNGTDSQGSATGEQAKQ
jgi:hypothetical protein